MLTVDYFKSCGPEEWGGFENPTFQALFKKELTPLEQKEVLWMRDEFYRANPPEGEAAGAKDEKTEVRNAHSGPGGEEATEPQDAYGVDREKQREFVEKRGMSFVFYSSYMDAMEDMDAEEALKCLYALCKYAFHLDKYGYPPTDAKYDEKLVRIFMSQAAPQLEASYKNRSASRRGGLASASKRNAAKE